MMMMMMMNYFCHIRPDELLYIIIIYVERDTATVSNSLLLTARCIASMKCGATSSNVCVVGLTSLQATRRRISSLPMLTMAAVSEPDATSVFY